MKKFLISILFVAFSLQAFCNLIISSDELSSVEDVVNNNRKDELLICYLSLGKNIYYYKYWEILFQPVVESTDSISKWNQYAAFPIKYGKKSKSIINFYDKTNNKIDQESISYFVNFLEKKVSVSKLFNNGLYEFSFITDIEGKIKEFNVKTQEGKDFNKSLNVIKEMLLWKPAINSKNEPVEMKVIVRTRSNARFPGGDEACFRWIQDHLKYPEECLNNAINGRVITHFIIDCDGTVTNIEVLNSPHPLLTQEVLRVINLMPKWEPATVSGKPEKARFHLPFNFSVR